MKTFLHIFFVSTLPIFVFAFFFGLPLFCSAEYQEELFFEIDSGTQSTFGDDFQQEFIAGGNSLSSFSFYSNTGFNHNIYYALCKGSISGSCYNGGNWCMSDPANSLIQVISSSTAVYGAGWVNLSFSTYDTNETTPGDQYFVCYDTGGSHLSETFRIYNDSPYTDIDSDIGGDTDIAIKFYKEKEYVYEYENAYVDPTLLSWRSDIQSVQSQICFIDEPCDLWFSFNDKAIGNSVYLTPDITGQQNPGFSIDSTVINFTGIWQNSLDLDIQSVATTTENCLYMADAEYGDLVLCGISSTWMSSSTFYDQLHSTIDINTICDNIATSSSTYFIECGIKKLYYHLFLDVDPRSVGYLMNGVEKFKSAFPLNSFFSLTQIVRDVMASTTLSNNGTLSFPLIDTSGNYYMADIISSSSIPNLIGHENSDLFRKFMDWMIWIGLIAIILTIIVII